MKGEWIVGMGDSRRRMRRRRTAISGGVARRVVRKIRRVTGESWAVGDSDQEPEPEPAVAFLPLPLSFHPQAGLQCSTIPILPSVLSSFCSHTVHLRGPQQKNVLLQ